MIKLKVPAITLEQMKFALEVAHRASDRQIPIDPTKRSITIVDDNGNEEYTLSFTDKPFNRAMIAIRDALANERGESDRDLFMAVMTRIQAMAEAAEWPMNSEYVKRNNEGEVTEIEEPLLAAASVCELSFRSMRFDKFKFRRAVKDFLA